MRRDLSIIFIYPKKIVTLKYVLYFRVKVLTIEEYFKIFGEYFFTFEHTVSIRDIKARIKIFFLGKNFKKVKVFWISSS